MKLRHLLLPLAAVVALGLITACGDDDDGGAQDGSIPGTDGVTETVRRILATAQAEEAPGQDVVLSQVVIPAGAELAPHTHPGYQLAFIVHGTLTYTVYEGEVVITRHAAGPSPTEERVSAGDTVDIEAGDALVEVPGMAHSAKNNGDEPIVIFLSSLFEEGAPASSPATVTSR